MCIHFTLAFGPTFPTVLFKLPLFSSMWLGVIQVKDFGDESQPLPEPTSADLWCYILALGVYFILKRLLSCLLSVWLL